ncbi:hypothetical protein PV682_21345 [Streptomyces niveiscabiei]|uniref:hypothetical protein n=1 Tax=Streptomyces niveiscabiei TaxID=164115 RepID=UPI0029BDC593|nr:hypothetical protein [Streptomyces niveiscabiei]MDX3383987.1 hypothetical protein [Streptomyces niveiscabiei]
MSEVDCGYLAAERWIGCWGWACRIEGLAILLVRNAWKGQDPRNTHAAEIALHELGFSILVRRRYSKTTGEPVVLNLDQWNSSVR